MKRITLAAAALALTAATAHAEVTIIDNDKTITVDCAKEKSVSILGNKATVTLNGTCEKVNVSGNKATVKGSAVSVAVLGNNNTVDLEAVDELLVAGNKNTVSYRKAVKLKTPKVSAPGNDNTVTQKK